MKTFRNILLCLMFTIFVDTQMVATINTNGENDNFHKRSVYTLEVPNYFYFKGTDCNLPTIIHERLQISWPQMAFQQTDTNKKSIEYKLYFANKNKLNDNDYIIKGRNELLTLEVNSPTEKFNRPSLRPDVSSDQRKIDHGLVTESSHAYTTISAVETDVGGERHEQEIMLKYSDTATNGENYLTSPDERDIFNVLSDITMTSQDNILKTSRGNTEAETKEELEHLNFNRMMDKKKVQDNDKVQITTERGNILQRKQSVDGDETREHGNIIKSSYGDQTSEHVNKLQASYWDETSEHENVVRASYGDETSEHENIIESSYGDETSEHENIVQASYRDETSEHENIIESSYGDETSEHENIVQASFGDETSDHENIDGFLYGNETGKQVNELEFSNTDHINTNHGSTQKSPSGYMTSSSDENKIIISSGEVSTTEYILEFSDSDLTIRENIPDYRSIQTTTEQRNIPDLYMTSDSNTTDDGTATDEANILKSSSGDMKIEPNKNGQESLNVHIKNDRKKLLDFTGISTITEQGSLLSSEDTTMDQGMDFSSTNIITDNINILRSSDDRVTINQDISNDHRNILEPLNGYRTTSLNEEDIPEFLGDNTTTNQRNMLDSSEEEIKIEPKDLRGSSSDHLILVDENIQEYVVTNITTDKENFIKTSNGKIANEQETFEVSEVDVTTQRKILMSSDATSENGQNNMKSLDGGQANILELPIANVTTEQRGRESLDGNETDKNNIPEFFRTEIMTEQSNVFGSSGVEIKAEEITKPNSLVDYIISQDDEGDSQKFTNGSTTTEKINRSLESLKGSVTIEQGNILETSSDNEPGLVGSQLITTKHRNIFETLGIETTTEQRITLESSGEHVVMSSADKIKVLKSSNDEGKILKFSNTTEQANVLDLLNDNIIIKQGNKFRSQNSDVDEFFSTQRIIKHENIPHFPEVEITSEQRYVHESPRENIAALDDGGDFLKFSSGYQVDGNINTDQAYFLQLDGVKDEQKKLFEFSEADAQVNLSSRVYGTSHHENEPEETNEIEKQTSKQELSKHNQVADPSNKIEFLEPEITKKQMIDPRSSNGIQKENINKLKKQGRSIDKWNMSKPLHFTNAKSEKLKSNNMEGDDTLKNSDFLTQDTQQMTSPIIKPLEIFTKPIEDFTKKITSVQEIPKLLKEMVHEVFNTKLELFVKMRQLSARWKNVSENRKINTIRRNALHSKK